jgi:uncharacterized protein DUF4382
MRRTLRFLDAPASLPAALATMLLLALGLFGCDNSCVVFVSNPGGGGGTISGSNTSCSLNQLNGNVQLQLANLAAPAPGDETARVTHIFVTIRAIEANSSATAADDSPGWQVLAPKLLAQPIQFDLLVAKGDSSAPADFGDAAVPADAYRQIRLRLVPNQMDATNSALESNSCGNVGFNCIVTSDGDTQPLALRDSSSQIHISSQQLVGGFVRVLPETTTKVKIVFNPQSSLFIRTSGVEEGAADEAMRLVPIFTVESETTDEPSTAANR